MKKENENRKNELWRQAYANLSSLYGDNPPVECSHRLVAEESLLRGTDAIQCFAALGKLCATAKEQSVPMVASTVNSSFAAWLMGATMVNPLPPHYRCPVCGKIEFISSVKNGFDLPVKNCSCGKELIRDGHNIPHQSFTNYLGNGIDTTIYTPEAFKPTAIRILQEAYANFAEILPVRFNADDPLPYVQYVACPLERENPTVSADGYWDTDCETFERWHSGATRFFFYSDEQIEQLHRQQIGTGIPSPDIQELLNPVLAEALLKSKYETLLEKSEHLPLREPVSFDLLLRIDGLFCAVDVWEDNTIDLLKEVRYLCYKGHCVTHLIVDLMCEWYSTQVK